MLFNFVAAVSLLLLLATLGAVVSAFRSQAGAAREGAANDRVPESSVFKFQIPRLETTRRDSVPLLATRLMTCIL